MMNKKVKKLLRQNELAMAGVIVDDGPSEVNQTMDKDDSKNNREDPPGNYEDMINGEVINKGDPPGSYLDIVNGVVNNKGGKKTSGGKGTIAVSKPAAAPSEGLPVQPSQKSILR